ncbi:MAG: hypothetical protein WA418_27080 [Bradyrhizobium sp.]
MGTIYRAVESFPPTADDFLSDIERGTRGAKKTSCKHWGCSVWETIRAVEHGRAIYDHFRTSYILVGDLDQSAGEVLTTPSKKQSEHATFWKVHKLDVSGFFKVALEPELPQQDDPLGPI